MEKIIAYFKTPYQERGLFWGTVDLLVRCVAVFIWVYLVEIIFRIVMDSLLLDYNPIDKLWWCSYGFLILFGATWLTYIALFVRNYYEND